MTIDELGSVGELVGAIATVATLLYLALQIRQSTAATRQTALYQAIESGSHVRREFVQNPDASSLYLRGCRDPDSLSPEDYLRFYMLVLTIFEQARLIFLQHQAGAASEAEWQMTGGWLGSVISEPGGARIWQDYAPSYEAFRAAAEVLPAAAAPAQQSAAADSA